MTFKEWAKDYFAQFPASEDTRREYTAAKAAWGAAHSVESVAPAPEVAKLVEALEGLLAITDESLGVSGYHLNRDMAKWCEFDEVDMAEEALALYRAQGGDL